MATTPVECVDALREAAERLGESPTKAQYEELGLTPASAMIIRVVGGWNDAKRAADLATNPSTGSRVRPPPDDVALPDGQSWDALSVDQRWHYRNVERNTRRSLERRRRLRHWLRIHRSTLGCSRCNEADPACLDFHHVTGEKERAVTEMVTFGSSALEIRDEIENCEVLCANCHRAEHVDEGPGSPDSMDTELTKAQRLRAWTLRFRAARGCRRCSTSEPSRHVFHHPEGSGKREGVGAMIANSRPEPAVKAEARRCVVLCANCHRREHDSEQLRDLESDRI